MANAIDNSDSTKKSIPNSRRISFWDSIYFYLDYALKILSEILQDSSHFIQRVLAGVLAYTVIVASNFFINRCVNVELINKFESVLIACFSASILTRFFFSGCFKSMTFGNFPIKIGNNTFSPPISMKWLHALIEFVETKKIPIMKKLGWYLDLRKRDALKPLPNWMLKALKFNRVKD